MLQCTPHLLNLTIQFWLICLSVVPVFITVYLCQIRLTLQHLKLITSHRSKCITLLRMSPLHKTSQNLFHLWQKLICQARPWQKEVAAVSRGAGVEAAPCHRGPRTPCALTWWTGGWWSGVGLRTRVCEDLVHMLSQGNTRNTITAGYKQACWNTPFVDCICHGALKLDIS